MKLKVTSIVVATVLGLSSTLSHAFAFAPSDEGDSSISPAAESSPAAPNPAATPTLNFTRDVAPLFQQHCVSCHSGAQPKGELLLTFHNEGEVQAKAASDKEFWRRVVAALSTKEMPPGEAKSKPTDAERNLLISWVNTDVLAIRCTDDPTPGRFLVRRLNNREYANTIRDLLYLPVSYDAAADFPADERGVGFDNNSDTLTISPVLIEHYIAAAEKAVKYAMNTEGNGNRESQRRLNAPRADYKEDFADWQKESGTVVELFAPRAYRRPVTKDEMEDLMRFVAISFAHDGESIDKASSLAMRAALMSPNFLFRLERDPEPDGTGKVFPVSEFELANRLSYFLWASMPDDKLFKAADKKTLRTDLETQVKRMLQDPKAISLVKDFAGQWLEIRGLPQTTNCEPALLASMQGETEHFIKFIIHEDRSIMDFLDANYTFVNERLAKHYGIEGITGEAFQKIAVDPNERGGIFTQASFLTLTAKPLGESRRTSPVNRGKWILENIFNRTIPPPPPDVPPLPLDNEKELKGTVRQIFEQHRADPKCATCHERMDPYGFALENYDGFGAWRKQDNKVDVDASGEIEGRKFTTPKEFREILTGRKDEFRRAFVAKLLQYALGRGIEDADKCAIDDICTAVEADGDRFSSVIMNLVKSYPFQHSRGSSINETQLAAAQQVEAKEHAIRQAKADEQARVAADAESIAKAETKRQREAVARIEVKRRQEFLLEIERDRAREAAERAEKELLEKTLKGDKPQTDENPGGTP